METVASSKTLHIPIREPPRAGTQHSDITGRGRSPLGLVLARGGQFLGQDTVEGAG